MNGMIADELPEVGGQITAVEHEGAVSPWIRQHAAFGRQACAVAGEDQAPGHVTPFEQFRQVEGAVIEKDMLHRIAIIREKLLEVAPFEMERVDKLRQRIYQNLEEYLGRDKVDENRFEQEILFYLEKIDISEEKLRLGQHCQYYLDELGLNASQKGRKLAFIAQEIGREINTLGAKAYSSEIQKRVVVMKDELEKIKEQIANCL